MMRQSLYLECASGISGDMTVAALLDLGADKTKLLSALSSLNVDGYAIDISRVNIHGIDANDFNVILEHDHEHHHDHEHDHEHHHDNEHHHEHGHAHRNLDDVTAIIESGNLTPHARSLALKIFRIVAEAESKAHGKPISEVHFHEVGAIDSIVDIVAVSVCLDDLNISDVIVCGLQEGTGFVNCQHGALPIPVPAVATIASAHGIPLSIHSNITGEMVTPTGIAIVAAIRTSDRLPIRFTVRKIGLGAGKRDFGYPNILRAMLLEYDDSTDSVSSSSGTVLLETNIDNATGEELGFALDLLMDAGALDALYIPAFMKKNRPAWMLRVICRTEDMETIEKLIFRSLPTIGIRRFPLNRTCLERFTIQITTQYGDVRVKCVKLDGDILPHPEYEDVKALALARRVSYRTVYDAAVAAAVENMNK